MPMALALLVSLCLVPLVSRIERLGVGRIAAVLATAIALVVMIGALGWVIGNEVSGLSENASEYRQNLARKARGLREPLGAIGSAAGMVGELERELEAPRTGGKVARVEVVNAEEPLDTLVAVVSPLAGPLMLASIVTVFTAFLLIQREDIRDRLIRLAGVERSALVTRAIDDISERLSRYLGMMGILCVTHALLSAGGLYLLGVPGALAWGVLAGALRIVPYVGPWASTGVAVAVSLAAFPGWMPALGALGLFVALELVQSNAIEPWLYGSSAGLSPLAVVLSAFVWTWLWGLPGLFLATPLTVCFVVLGRYVEPLAFLRTLFGEDGDDVREATVLVRVGPTENRVG